MRRTVALDGQLHLIPSVEFVRRRYDTGFKTMSSISTDLDKLKHELQNEQDASNLEHLAAALLSHLLDVPIAVAASGFQYGADAGAVGQRRLRLECKKYTDTSQLKERELLGEIDQALARDDALEAWILVSVCQKTPLSELSCHDPPHFPRQLQPNFVQEDASDRSGWGDWWWTGPDLRDAAIGRRSRLLGSGFKG